MVALKEVPELHDKIIVSTAQYLKLPIITKDRILQELPSVKTISWKKLQIIQHIMIRTSIDCPIFGPKLFAGIITTT
jgi:hypothetical protein